MANITIKNIPDDLYEKLKKSAKIKRRSINQEIIVCIEESVQEEGSAPDELIENARRLRTKTDSYPVKNEELNQIKRLKRL